MPPPSVRPEMPVVEMIPPVVARPKAWVAWLKSPQVAPGVGAGRLVPRIDAHGAHLRHVDDQAAVVRPESGPAVPPPRTERSSPCSRAKFTAAMTSATCSAFTMPSGRLSNMPL